MLTVFMVNSVQALSVDSTITDIKQSTSTAINAIDTSSTFKQIYSDVKSGITGLASALKVTAEHVYGILVKQQIVNSIVYLLTLIIAILILIFCYKEWNKIEIDLRGDPKETQPFIFTIVSGIIGITLLLVFLFNIDTMIMGFINPEYGAIMDIINFVR
mgnify:CR=1 FL=1